MKVPIAELAGRYGVNENTVRKWLSRTDIIDAPVGLKKPRRTILSVLQEAVIVSLRFQAWLTLDNVYIALKTVFPHLLRSNLYRCLQQHGISRLSKAETVQGICD